MPWDDADPDEDPRVLFGLEELVFGAENGLWPITSTDRGETVFLAPGPNAPCLLVEDGQGGWSQHSMSFAEWLYRSLIGEDMAGPKSSAFYRPGEAAAPPDVRRRTPRTLVRPRSRHVRNQPHHQPQTR